MNKSIQVDESTLTRYFSGVLTEDEKMCVEAWMAKSKKNKDFAKKIYYILFAADSLSVIKETDTASAYNRFRKNVNRNRWRFALKQVQRAAAILTVPLLCAMAYYVFHVKSAEVEYIEAKAEQGLIASLTLPDSSKVWLNSGSSIKYPARFTGKERDVTLCGEAYFAVTHDAKHKFVVNTGKGIQIEVLGTEFNVDAYPENPEVSASLVNGKINLKYTDNNNVPRQLVMAPNQKTVINTVDGSIRRSEMPVGPDIAWKDGKIVFDNTSLEDALKILGKRFQVEFRITNPKLKACSFSGAFENQSLDVILKHLYISSNIRNRNIPLPPAGKENTKQIIEIY